MTLSSGMVAVQDDPSLIQFFTFEVDLPASQHLPAKTLCLLDGSGVVSFGGKTYLGSDGDYGAWGGAEPIEEAVAAEAPRFSTTLLPLSDEVVQQLCQPTSQNAPITIYMGWLNPATGQPVDDPDLVFAGALDVGHLTIDTNTKSVVIDVMSAWELMFRTNEGATLSTAYHQQFFPGELGFEFVDNVDHQVPWGGKGPRPDQSTGIRNYDNQPGAGATSLKF